VKKIVVSFLLVLFAPALATAQNYQWPNCDASHPCVLQYVQSAIPTEAVNGIQISLPNQTLPGNTVVCGVTHDSNLSITSIVDAAGDVWVRDKAIAATDASSDLWHSKTSAGTVVLKFNFTSNTNPNFGAQISCAELYGVSGQVTGSSASNSTSSTVTAGSLSVAANDLVYNYGMSNYAYPGTDLMLNSISGNGNLVGADIQFGIATQVSVPSASGTVNPTFNVSQSNPRLWNSLAASYKFDGSGTLPSSGIRVVHVQHVYSQGGSSGTIQLPSTGNLRILSTTNNTTNYAVTNVRDDSGATYAKVTQPYDYLPQIFYAANASPSLNRKLTWSQVNPSTHFIAYDVAGADPAPLDTIISAGGSQNGGNADIANAPVFTPNSPNTLVLALLEFGTGPPSGAATAGMIMDSMWAIGMTDTSGFDTGDGWAHYYSSSTNPFAFNWHVSNGGQSTGWDTLAVSFKSGSATATQPDFALSASPTSQSVGQQTQTSYTVSVTPSGGFSSSVNLAVSGLPPGASGQFTVNPATSSSTLQVNSGSAATGSYPLTITGASGALTHSTTVALNITAAPDFSLGISPSSQSITTNTSGNFTVNVSSANGFSDPVTLSATGLPSTVSFSSNPTTGSSTITANAGSTPGTYPFTVTGTSGTLTHTVSGSLTVTDTSQPGSFTLSADPTSSTVTRGSSTSYSIGIARVNFTGSVAFSVSGLPSGLRVYWSQNPTSANSTTLTLRASRYMRRGTYSLTVTGTSGSLQSSVPIGLTVR
jgi:hypothetical protein